MKPRLSCSPETKTLTFPVWRDERKHLFSVKDITGAFAMWAVRQSPYDSPDLLGDAVKNLEQVLVKRVKFDNEPLRFAELSCSEIRTALYDCFESIAIIEQWNRPKSGHNALFVTSSRYDSPLPDDDIIDLDALARNIAHTLILERLIEEDHDEISGS